MRHVADRMSRYVNFASGDEDLEQIHGFGERLQRLRSLRRSGIRKGGVALIILFDACFGEGEIFFREELESTVGI